MISIFRKTNIRGVYALMLSLLITGFLAACSPSNDPDKIWTEFSSQEKPWTRWWWMGNAVDKENITIQLEAFAAAGLGGVEITPIYGVKGYEEKFIDFLSPEWMQMLDHTLLEAERLGLGVDMVMGTGWPFGGPQVEPQFAASRLWVKKYRIDADATFHETIQMDDPKQKGLAELQHVFYFDNNNERKDITPLVKEGVLAFTPSDNTELYAVFCAKTRQRVKRAAPGGDGYTLDHFSEAAFNDYAVPYEAALPNTTGRLRALFNDSYEVYNADYSPVLIETFRENRQYDLLDHLETLLEKPEGEAYERILSDYRETLSDLLINDFARSWDQWSNALGIKTKYQAHGSPGNLIDLYAAADIPECEMFGSPVYNIPGYRRDTSNIRKGDSNKMMLKFSSSAAHLQGKELVSSESFTWLREHFKTALHHCKPVTDDFFLSGVNHMFLHGSTYSPSEDPWPGFKFYASVNFNPTNTIWRDAPYLFAYIARCQSILQKATSDNEVLIYWPVYDAYATAGQDRLLLQLGIHSIEEWLLETSFYEIAETLDQKGFGFDFISDKFILEATAKNGMLNLAENASYQAIVVPDMQYIPLETMQKLVELKERGATVLFAGQPSSVPGYYEYEAQNTRLHQLIQSHPGWFSEDMDLEMELNNKGIFGEKAAAAGLKFIRKKLDGAPVYFVANHSPTAIDQYITFNAPARSVLLMDPMTGKKGTAKTHADKNTTDVKLYLEPGASMFILMHNSDLSVDEWKYPRKFNGAIPVTGEWNVSFTDDHAGDLPELRMEHPSSWTGFGQNYSGYSGTAVYTTTFHLEQKLAEGYRLDLGDVRESARVYVNGTFAGVLIAHPFTLDISDLVAEGENELKIEVTNLPANRLREMEINGKEWKKFYEINMVNIHYQRFDASVWEPTPSGLNGEVSLVPVYYQ